MGSPAIVAAERAENSIKHRIPSLDGLRAVSIAMVVLSHTKALLPAPLVRSGVFRYLIGGGLHGVQVFFVISGYLITGLLLRELVNPGGLSLKRFYIRRMLRIFPPFYIYLLVIALLWVGGWRGEDAGTFFAAATYTIVYLRHPEGWLVQHAWSLSIEEQFYVIWPAVLLLAHRHRVVVKLAILLMAAMPVLRLVIAVRTEPAASDHVRLLVNLSSIDMLMMGCLLAVLKGRKAWCSWCERWIHGWVVAVLGALGLVLVPYTSVKLATTEVGVMVSAFGYSITAIAIGAALEYIVRKPESIVGRVLTLRVMRHVGAISYSIYLWQQLFTGSEKELGLLTYPLILIAAELSFRLVELPAMGLRRHLAL